MMNFLALGLVLTTVVTAGFFSPTPQNHPKSSEDNVIVKEGHRFVVVEYEKDDGNTKVSISPQDSPTLQRVEGNDKLSEKMEGVKDSVVDEMDKFRNQEGKFRPRELVCDAYGKCKHKIAAAFERTKEASAEKVYAAEEAAEKIKDTVAHAADKVGEAEEKVKDSANKVLSKTVEKASEKAAAVKDDAVRAAEKARAAAERARKGARGARKQGQKELREILRHAAEVAGDVFDYVALPAAAVVHLMGFAAAYGMCVWITFASSYVLAAALPRQQFAVVQSKIYPVYFKAVGCGVGMALLGHLVGPSRRLSPPGVAAVQGLNLAAALGMILVNLMWLEPRATKVMIERMKKEKEEGTGKDGHAVEPTTKAADSIAETAGRVPTSEEAAARSQIIHLSQTLQRLNSYSSFLNALTLVSLTWHLVHLSQRLHAAC